MERLTWRKHMVQKTPSIYNWCSTIHSGLVSLQLNPTSEQSRQGPPPQPAWD